MQGQEEKDFYTGHFERRMAKIYNNNNKGGHGLMALSVHNRSDRARDQQAQH